MHSVPSFNKQYLFIFYWEKRNESTFWYPGSISLSSASEKSPNYRKHLLQIRDLITSKEATLRREGFDNYRRKLRWDRLTRWCRYSIDRSVVVEAAISRKRSLPRKILCPVTDINDSGGTRSDDYNSQSSETRWSLAFSRLSWPLLGPWSIHSSSRRWSYASGTKEGSENSLFYIDKSAEWCWVHFVSIRFTTTSNK